jgi:DNA-binding MarR family transcriptional regulator
MDKHSLEAIDLELAVLLRRLTSITTKKLSNMDRSAYLLLHRIISNGPARVKTLALEFQLDISTVSRQVSALEQKGYVNRIPDPLDGRTYALEITDLGKKEFYEYQHIRYTKLSDVLKDWSDEDCEKFGQLLRKYNRPFQNVE